MKLSQVPNLRTEDFQDQQDWIGRLFIQLTPFLNSLNHFSENVEFAINVKSVSQQYAIQTFQEFKILWTPTDSEPRDVRVISAYRGTAFTPTNLLCAWSYDKGNKQVIITKLIEVLTTGVSGLNGDDTYTFTVRATV